MVNLLTLSGRMVTQYMHVDIAVIPGELDIALCKSEIQDGHCRPWADADCRKDVNWVSGAAVESVECPHAPVPQLALGACIRKPMF
jgi:hypothetical protein